MTVKLGTISYNIRLSVTRVEKKNFKKGDILYRMEKENARSISERVGDKFYIY